MKKLVLFLIVIAAAGYLTYQYSPEAREIAADWIANYLGTDAESTAETVSKTEPAAPQPTKKPKKRVQKVLKPGPFDRLDRIAKNTSAAEEKSMENLVQYLVSKGGSETEKARLIFTWIATHIKYDDQSYNSKNYADMSAQGVFKRRAGVCEGYSNLVLEMCSLAGLECKKVIGYSKGYGYQLGARFTETDHAWNIIKTNGKWGLYDATWAAGYGETVKGKLKSTMEFDDYWFNVKPEEFLFTHFPENPNWLFTSSKYTLADFENLPYARKSFFKLGFDAQKAIGFNGKGKVNEFTSTYSLKYPLKIVKAPYVKQLPNNRTYEIVLESEYMDDIQLLNGKDWIPFEKNGNSFSVKVKPQLGSLKVLAKAHSWENTYPTAMEYEVVDVNAL